MAIININVTDCPTVEVPAWAVALQNSAGLILNRQGEIMATLAEILALVQAQDTELDGVRSLITGLREQVAAIGNLTPEQQAQVDAIFAQATANSAEIAQAIADVPAAPV